MAKKRLFERRRNERLKKKKIKLEDLKNVHGNNQYDMIFPGEVVSKTSFCPVFPVDFIDSAPTNVLLS